jgi:RNA polymerase sigma-70 factor, ECF subfamily
MRKPSGRSAGGVAVSPAHEDEVPTDSRLMLRAQAGDVDAFAELYDRHCAGAFGVARAACRDTLQAEDAVQDGFLAIWRSRASYREGVGGFRVCAMRVVRKRAIDSTSMPHVGEPDAMPA